MNPIKVIKLPDIIRYPKTFDLFEKQTKQGPEASRIYMYYENLSNGKWTTTKCNNCGEIMFPPRVLCPSCYSESLSFMEIEKEGTLYTFATLEGGVPFALKSIAPFTLGVVRFEKSGLQIAGRVYGKKYKEMKIGDKVTWGIERIEGPGPLVRHFPCFTYI